jgi:hypothetical protein
MIRTFYRITLKQIIRPDRYPLKAIEKVPQGFVVIVDTPKQDGLI